MQRTEKEALWRSVEIVDEMMQHRGFKVSVPRVMTIEEFKDITDPINFTTLEKLAQLYVSVKAKGDKSKVIWMNDLRVEGTHTLFNVCSEEKVNRIIVVVRNKITPKSLIIIKDIERVNKLVVEIFYESSLQYNPLKHVDVPMHTIYSNQAKKSVLKSYGIPATKFPKIKSNDPIVKFIGGQKGQMIRITSPVFSDDIFSDTKEKREIIYHKVFYRIVV